MSHLKTFEKNFTEEPLRKIVRLLALSSIQIRDESKNAHWTLPASKAFEHYRN